MGGGASSGPGTGHRVSLGAPIIAPSDGAHSLVPIGTLVVAFVVVSIVLPKRRGLDHEEPREVARRRESRRWTGSAVGRSRSRDAVMLGLSIGPSVGWTSVWASQRSCSRW